MIKSMTAYGRGEAEGPDQKWVVEFRGLNHRFLELSLNLPKRLWGLEDRLRKLIKSRISRGRVEMQLTWESTGEKALTLEVDPVLARQTAALLQEILDAGSLTEPLRLDNLLHFSDLFITKENQEFELEATWGAVSQAVTRALDVLDQMRLTEGAALAADLAESLKGIRREAARIQEQAPLLPQLWREKVSARLAELVGETGVDETRLAQEVAYLAERRDLSEELARLESHLTQFHETLAAQVPVGRKQEFLLQEMLREANTMGSKAGDLLITQAVLEIKGYLERLREQVQNIE
jgi:uncharacterized protein (TIGR00255 family)